MRQAESELRQGAVPSNDAGANCMPLPPGLGSRSHAFAATIRDRFIPRGQSSATALRQRWNIAFHQLEDVPMKLPTLLTGTALLAMAGIALAQGGPGPDRPGADGPGPHGDVTRQQVIAHTDEMFARLDA